MLLEATLRLSARTDPPLRKLGLVRDAVALWSRATRQRRAWAPHEARCHTALRGAIESLASRRMVLVLGSGLIRDVPLPSLAEQFDRVVLLDAVHLLPARLRARRAGAEIAVGDLTGTARWLVGEAAGRTDPLARWREDPTLDLVISANVLAQLPMAIESWLDQRKGADPAPPAELPDEVVRWHLEDLASLRCRVCVLTDVGYRVVDRRGGVVEEEDLLRGATLPAPDAAWDWTVAPFGELARNEAHIHRVHFHADFRLR